MEVSRTDLILMASVSVLVSAAHVSVSEVPALSIGSREPASVSRPASRPNLDGLGLGHPCLGLGYGCVSIHDITKIPVFFYDTIIIKIV